MPFPHPIRSLAQVPDLAPLADVCRALDVEITAFGSVVRRLARALVAPEGCDSSLPDLFELSPFLSDVDLWHSGPPEQTETVRRAILAAIPFSECFRWEISSQKELEPYWADEAHLPVIPVNKMSLGTRAGRGIDDPFNGYRDLRDRTYRLLRSPHYHRSSLRREHRDCEFLYVLNYLKVVFEEPELDLDLQPGWPVALQIARDARTPELLGALEESAYLRARFRYRSQAMRASCRDVRRWNQVVYDEAFRETRLFIQHGLPFPVLDIPDPKKEGLDSVLAASCRLVGDRFRLQLPPIAPAHAERASEAYAELSQERHGLDLVSKHALPQVPEGQRIVGDTPEFLFHPGRAPSALEDEHLHVQLTLSEETARVCREIGERGLGAFIVLTAMTRGPGESYSRSHSIALPAPTVCWLVEGRRKRSSVPGDGEDGPASDDAESADDTEALTRLQLRANCGQMLAAIPEILWTLRLGTPSSYRLKLFVVGQS
jgi:hypothetical protein